MASIFKQNLDINNHPNRNNHDLTHKVHGSYQFGKIYPFFCKPVVPSDTFQIDTACGFQLMPMPFPTQTNMRAIFHYFYVRNKNIWENWENFAEGLEEHEPPYIDKPYSWYKSSSLADYLDIPTTLSSDNISVNLSASHGLSDPLYAYINLGRLFLVPPMSGIDLDSLPHYGNYSTGNNYDTILFPMTPDVFSTNHYLRGGSFYDFHLSKEPFGENVDWTKYFGLDSLEGKDFVGKTITFSLSLWSSSTRFICFIPVKVSLVQEDESDITFRLEFSDSFMSTMAENGHDGSISIADYIKSFNVDVPSDFFFVFGITLPYLDTLVGSDETESDFMTYVNSSLLQDIVFGYNLGSSVVDIPNQLYCPYYYSLSTSNEKKDTIKVSALPFRAYESIYNAYYRNTVVQPFKIGGVNKYNRYNTNLGDGSDTFDYQLMLRNWELDAYTSCLPSPQQGNAPLVGMNVLGDVTIEDANGITTAHYTEDGETGKVVVTSPLADVSHGRILMNLAQSGISINDFRATNALQRYLETNIRKGYKYIDYIQGHFGIKPKYNELDMPEFIGGFSQMIDVNMISNTNGVGAVADSEKLGSYAGQARSFGGSKHSIRHFCDDYGYIIGLVTFVPDAAYSQILPKHYTYSNPLDWFLPEFSQIGMQPLTYEELCPIQSHIQYRGDSSKKLTDTFGYQRPNHEYIWYPDTLHGQFRTSLKDYVVNRVFSSRPELGNNFLTINPSEVNNIFAVTEENNDVIIGQIVVSIKAKRPVPRIVVPGLGR